GAFVTADGLSRFDSNGSAAFAASGINVAGGAFFVGTNISAAGNQSNGASISGPASTIALHGVVFDGNGISSGGSGLFMLNGTAGVDQGSAFTNNGGNGI